MLTSLRLRFIIKQKTNIMNKKILSVILAFTFAITSFAQSTNNGGLSKTSHKVEDFDAISVSGARTVYLTQGDEFSVVVEADQKIQEFVTLEVENNTLKFGFSKKITKYNNLNFYVTAPSYKGIKASGASEVKSIETLVGNDLKINASGATDIKLDVKYESIVSRLSGASDVTLNGTAVSSIVQCSGASDFRGKNLKTSNSVVTGSGASSCFVNATENITYEVSGASDVKYVSTPETVIVQNNKTKKVYVTTDTTQVVTHYHNSDTTKVNMGVIKVVVVDGDTTQVSVGRHTLSVSEDGDVDWKRCKKHRFNGHWGGVEIGINGYLTPSFNTDFAPADDYLALRWEKSINVNINVYEQNIPLNKAKNIGLITGIGMHWNNYRFSKQTFLTPDSSAIAGYYMDGVSVRKTKLTAMYITVPLLFEMQTKHDRRANRFHFAVGAQVSARISTHTKIYFNESNKPYDLVDPVTGTPVSVGITPTSNSRNIVKNFNSFHLAPFKFDGMVRFGYGVINIYATYSLNTMFSKNRGPELYPFTAGITLVGW